MTAPLLVRGARQLLTLRGSAEPRRGFRMRELGVIDEGSLLIIGETIAEAGPTRRVVNLARARDASVIDASGCVMLPGFNDPRMDLLGHTPTLLGIERRTALLLEHGTTSIGCLTAVRKYRHFVEKARAASIDIVRIEPSEEPQSIALVKPFANLLAGATSTHPREHIDGGHPLALATGFDAASIRSCSMQAVIALACLQLNLTVEEAISAATTNAAHSLGIGKRAGALEPDRQADVVLLQVPDYRQIPYHFGVNLVRTVIKRGKVVYQRGDRGWTGN
ncbi:MAG: amidohydrolase family protein [Bryobacterales bacterium]|nr:amidohydrolase family protein [Bryobacterales bacterium]